MKSLALHIDSASSRLRDQSYLRSCNVAIGLTCSFRYNILSVPKETDVKASLTSC